MAKIILGVAIVMAPLTEADAKPRRSKASIEKKMATKKVSKKRVHAKSAKRTKKGVRPPKTAKRRSTASLNLGEFGASAPAPNRPFEIRGQSRTLSMMLVLKNDKETLNFVKVRNSYKQEILNTQF